MADLHVLRETNLKNVSATLRNIADDIDHDKYGDVRAACIVLDAFKLQVHFMGAGEAGPEAYLLLGMGQYKMAKLIFEEKERAP